GTRGRARAVTGRTPTGVGRRGVLTAGIAGVLGATVVAACGGAWPAQPPRPSPLPDADDRAAARARAAAVGLVRAAEELADVRPDLAGLLDTVVADHRAHLGALGAAAASGPGPSSDPPTPSAAPTPSGSARPPSVVDLPGMVDRERAAAQGALDDVGPVSPGLAALLARIAASRAVHADLLAAREGLPAPGVLRTSPASLGTGGGAKGG